MDEDDGFIPVRRKAKARPARKPKPANPAAASSSGSRGFSYRASSAAAAAAAAADTDADLDLDLDLDLDVEQRTVEAVERALSMLDTHLPHLASVLDAVWPQPEAQGRRPTAVLCLGLGSVSTSRSAQIQLALLVRILRWLPHSQSHSHSHSPRPTTHACAFDPVFTHVDRAVLARYGVHADTHDHAGRYAITQDTLAFMPHCPLPLYERLVRTNSPTLHHRTLTLLANRLDRYADAMPHARLAARAPAIQRILHHLETVPLPNLPTPHADALNDLAFQRYTGAELDAQLGPEQELPRDPDGNEILH